jgi:hypothetical protein
MDQFERYLQFKKEVAQATIKVAERFQQPGEERPKKRTSNIDIVLDVLHATHHPLHITEIIDLVKQGHGIELSRDSIVSALLKKVHAGQGVVRTGPNTFATVKEGP